MKKWMIILLILAFGALSFILVYEMVLKNFIRKLGVLPQAIVEVVELEEDIVFHVRVYMTKSFSIMFLNKTIDTVFLEDEDQTIDIEFTEATDLGSFIEDQGIRFKAYTLGFKLVSEEIPILWKFEKASVRFCFLDESEIAFEVGYVWLEKSEKLDSLNQDLIITRLRGFSKTENGKQTLGGIVIGIRNDSEFEVLLEDIVPKHDYVKLRYQDSFSIIKGIPIQDTDVDSFLGTTLDLYQDIEQVHFNLKLKPNEEVQYFFPLMYSKNFQMQRLGFRIHYVKQEQKYEMDKAPFLFFLETKEKENNLLEMKVYKWSEFK